jgi:phosphate acetyltransferase
MVAAEGYATVILLGDLGEIKTLAQKERISLEGVTLWDPRDNPDADSWVDALYDKRKHKGMTRDEAAKLMKDRLYIGAMMVSQGGAHGMVAGAITATSKVVRTALHIIGPREGMRTVSSCFMMVIPHCLFGVHGTLMYGDCGHAVFLHIRQRGAPPCR